MANNIICRRGEGRAPGSAVTSAHGAAPRRDEICGMGCPLNRLRDASGPAAFCGQLAVRVRGGACFPALEGSPVIMATYARPLQEAPCMTRTGWRRVWRAGSCSPEATRRVFCVMGVPRLTPQGGRCRIALARDSRALRLLKKVPALVLSGHPVTDSKNGDAQKDCYTAFNKLYMLSG